MTRFGKTADLVRYQAFMVTPEFNGSLDEAPLWAGESCSLVNDIKPAAAIVRDVVREAEALLDTMRRP